MKINEVQLSGLYSFGGIVAWQFVFYLPDRRSDFLERLSMLTCEKNKVTVSRESVGFLQAVRTPPAGNAYGVGKNQPFQGEQYYADRVTRNK